MGQSLNKLVLSMNFLIILLAFVSMAQPFPILKLQELHYPIQKLDPMVTMMPNITSSTPMLLPLMCLNGVTVVEMILNISEKNTCPKRNTTSKTNCVGEMLMRVKENNSMITTVEHMVPLTKHPSTVHP